MRKSSAKKRYVAGNGPDTVEQYRARILSALLKADPALDLSQVTLSLDLEEDQVIIGGVDEVTLQAAYSYWTVAGQPY